jgi:hypothetical protein
MTLLKLESVKVQSSDTGRQLGALVRIGKDSCKTGSWV